MVKPHADSPNQPPMSLPVEGRKTPRPVGLPAGKRTWKRHFVQQGLAYFNRLFDCIPGSQWIHRRFLEKLIFTDVSINLEKGGRGLEGLRVAFISDVHAGSFISENDIFQIFTRVAERKPDLVCLGGDMVNTRLKETFLLKTPLQLLSPPLGIFAVPGNHEHFFKDKIGMWQEFLEGQGVQVLMNRGTRLSYKGSTFWIAGVDDLSEGTPNLDQALDGRRHQEPVLLLSHNPDFFDEARAAGVDLTLSGHTHGGQIKIFGRMAIKRSRRGYHEGHYQAGQSHLYVGRGVGATVLPLRFNAPAEIPWIRFTSSPTPI